ncbi:MAG TPA: YqaE/Pmp3 family membrane protein [Planctomycetota bacterium]|nr:YqaE/Pmp3 family membrane protein [Planctomycetota bacterium]
MFVKIIIALLLPPLAVFMHEGTSKNFIINIVLTILGFWIVGIVHAIYIITHGK